MPYKTRGDKRSVLLFKDTADAVLASFPDIRGYDAKIRRAFKLPPRK